MVDRVGPHALVGVTGQPGIFTEAVIRAQAAHVDRPIVLPLSNPTPRAEAIPADVLAWTDGAALIGTGSPFEPVDVGRLYHWRCCWAAPRPTAGRKRFPDSRQKAYTTGVM